MKTLGSLAVLLACLSLLATILIVVEDQGARYQLIALDFPLTALHGGKLAMLVPLGLSLLATLGSLLAIFHRIGRLALVASLVSWGAIWLVLGERGFRYLF